MKKYFYKAASFAGEHVTGEEAAEDEKELAKALHERGFVLTEAKEQGRKRFSFSLDFSSNLFGVTLIEKLMFVRNLKVMIGAGVALPKALEILSEQVKSKKFKTAVLDMQEQVFQGKLLSQTMESHKEIFPELFQNMVKVGEESGTLEEVLSQLALQLEKEHELQSQIMGALLYPAVVVSAMFGIGILMLILVVPKLADTFKDLGVQLPVTTRFVIGFGKLLSEKWFIVFPAFAVFFGACVRALHTRRGKRFLDILFLKLPLLSSMVQKTNSAVTLRTLSSLIASGVPIVRALEITSHVVGNSFYQEALQDTAKEVAKGAKISDSLARSKHLYPTLIIQMVQVGEETGESSQVLSKLAEFFEEEVTQVTKNLASVIEPLLMLLIGAVVGFFAVSMIQPMYSILNSVK
ncbi:MAG: type II secretion system F family protein [Candidatus Wildermuthbacteria bacterium]|nr:type II secretion system F family protein [Candidatus Wildermuthbacteria bacterium]